MIFKDSRLVHTAMGKALKAASVSQAKTKKKKPNNKVLTNMKVAKTMEKPDASEGDPIFSKNPWSTYVRSYCPHHVRFDATSIYLKMDKGMLATNSSELIKDVLLKVSLCLLF